MDQRVVMGTASVRTRNHINVMSVGRGLRLPHFFSDTFVFTQGSNRSVVKSVGGVSVDNIT